MMGAVTDNLSRDYPSAFLETWEGCAHLDCLSGCLPQPFGHCERLEHAWKDWLVRTSLCPKCQRIKHDWDCAEDNCPMAA